jgi:ATP-dependent Lon protease
MKNLRRFGTKNPVILLDEVDRVADTGRASIMGVLLELLDPEQNSQFVDYYIDFPFDLSEVMFICTANNTHGISNAVLDRLEVIEMPSYTDDEKRIIGRDYLLPRVMERTGLTQSQISISENLWPKIIRPLGYDSGIRTLERTLEGICRKVARKIVEGEGTAYELTESNIKEFLPTW